MKYLLLLFSSLYINQFVFSQELKTFKGSFDNFQDEFLGVNLLAENGAQAQFTFFLDANEQMVKHGNFLAEQSRVFSVSNQSFGYSGSASGRQYGRVTGSYKNNIKVGLWKYQKVQFGMNLSGAQFDFRKLEWNSLSINNSKEIESIRTVSVNYDNGIPEGEMKDEVFEKGIKVLEIKCSIHDGHFVGAFAGKSTDRYGISRYGKFDQNGFYDGEWVDGDPYEGTINKWNFIHGVLISYVSHTNSTGVKVKEYKNTIVDYILKNQLPKGLVIDTIEYYKQGKYLYSAGYGD
ncbi:MAG: hypothetical protein IPP81_19130 [Chitinophagaceae bacterium]|nr:hypothetical protein [Chitinophagaceae bacterium]